MAQVNDTLSDDVAPVSQFVTPVSDFVPVVSVSDFVAQPFVFKPLDKRVKTFTLEGFLWPHLLSCFGYLFPEVTQGIKYFRTPTKDKRFHTASISTHDGFRVTEEESKIIARMVRNYVATQNCLHICQPQTVALYADREFPEKINRSWIDIYDKFTVFAETSLGFTIE